MAGVEEVGMHVQGQSNSNSRSLRDDTKKKATTKSRGDCDGNEVKLKPFEV